MASPKETIVAGSLTLLSAAATAVLGDRLSSSGDLTLPVSLLSASGTVLLGLLSYLVILWRRDQKRERIRFAREMGRPVCGCTTDGVISVIDPKKSDSVHKIYVCPLCGDKTAVQAGHGGVGAMVG